MGLVPPLSKMWPIPYKLSSVTKVDESFGF